MIGKLYVLSLIYLMYVASILPGPHAISDVLFSNAWPLETDEHSTAFMSTFTIPMEVIHTRARDSRGEDGACGEIVAAEYGSSRTIEFAV